MASTGAGAKAKCECACGLKCPYCVQEVGAASVCERRQLAHELNRWRGYKRQTVASAMQAHPPALPLSRPLRQSYDAFLEARSRSPHRCNCRCRCHRRSKKNGVDTKVLATLLRRQEEIERSIDSRPPFAVRHVASELLHRSPGMDPLGPMVHAWNNILEHPDHDVIEFDERFKKFRLRTGADGIDDAAIEEYGFPVGGNVPSELGAGTAYCPVCAAYNRYTGHRYRLGLESEAREDGDREEEARARPPPPPCRHATAPAEKDVDGDYGPAPRVRVVREPRRSSSYGRVMPGHERECHPAPETLPSALTEKQAERSTSPLYTSYRYGFGGRDHDLPRPPQLPRTYGELDADRCYRDVYHAHSSYTRASDGLGLGLELGRDLPAERTPYKHTHARTCEYKNKPWRDRPASARAQNLFSLLSAEQRAELASLERDLKGRSLGALDVHQPWVGRTSSCTRTRAELAEGGARHLSASDADGDGDGESVSASEELDDLT